MDQREFLRRRESRGCLIVGCLVAFLVLGAAGSAAASDAPYRVCIVGLDANDQPVLPPDYTHAFAGELGKVGVWIDPIGGSAQGIQRFELLLCYDINLLACMAVKRGAGLASGWEYFTYRYDQPGQIRLIGVADLPGGVPPNADVFNPRGLIARIEFYVTPDASMMGLCPHVSFCSYTCSDNVLLSREGDSLYLPTGTGLTPGSGYDLNACLQGGGPVAPVASVDFCPGAICINPSYLPCGDVNLNGIHGEIADIILFCNYFMYGPTVFEPIGPPWPYPWYEMDCDGDGHVGVSDLVTMIRMFLGGFPLGPAGSPKPAPSANSTELTWNVSGGALRVRTTSAADIGGLRLTYRYSGYEAGDASLHTESGMSIQSVATEGELRLLVYPDPTTGHGMVPAGSHDLVTVPLKGNGTIELADQEACDYAGGSLALQTAQGTPREYGLLQNYPNPFNAGTVIPFRLERDSEWKLAIHNVAGQVVRTFDGRDAAGLVQVAWDGTTSTGAALASGVYFSRLEAGGTMSSRRIVLMK